MPFSIPCTRVTSSLVSRPAANEYLTAASRHLVPTITISRQRCRHVAGCHWTTATDVVATWHPRGKSTGQRSMSGCHMASTWQPRVIHVAATCHSRGSHVSPPEWATWQLRYISQPILGWDSKPRPLAQ
ncbi:hypothetical protein Tco_0541385 [Tanacetum coccineum]